MFSPRGDTLGVNRISVCTAPLRLNLPFAVPLQLPVAKNQNVTVTSFEQVEVPAQEAGVLVALQVREGQLLAEGDLLSPVDLRPPESRRPSGPMAAAF